MPTCKNQTFTEEQWRTFLAETTYLINSRPLYPSSERVWESPPITPNDILIGSHNSPPQPESEEKINPRDLLRSTEDHGRTGRKKLGGRKEICPTFSDCARPVPKKLFVEQINFCDPPPKNFDQCTILGVQKFFRTYKIFRNIKHLFHTTLN